MSKVKVKKIKTSASVKDTEMAEMFNQMLGTGTINSEIVYPKFIRIHQICRSYVDVCQCLANARFMQKDEIHEYSNQLLLWCDTSKKLNCTLFQYDYSFRNTGEIPDTQKLADSYEQVKKSSIVCDIIKTLNQLVVYKEHLDMDKHDIQFVYNIPGVEWFPLSFSKLNFKQVLLLVNSSAVSVILFAINHLYSLGLELYNILQSPDIDIEKFIEILKENLVELRKQPAISRCNLAFNKINQSVDLLRTNFNNYYRDFVTSRNPTIMMENFILDVSASTEADPALALQFKQIVQYYKKSTGNHSKNNSKYKMLFDKMNESFESLDSNTPNITIKK